MVVGKFCKIWLVLVFIQTGCESQLAESQEWHVNLGENITLPCYQKSIKTNTINFRHVMWVKTGREEKQISRLKILSDGSLSLERVIKSDTGEYWCTLENDRTNKEDILSKHLNQKQNEVHTKYKLIVRTPPPLLVNVSIHPSTVLALLLWDVNDTGGYDISYFCAQYRLKNDPFDSWHNVLPEHISPSTRQIDVYQLLPNSTYTFQIWAVNDLGKGEITQIDGTTNHIPEEIELARHLLQGAENFDTRIWVVAVAVVMGTLLLLSFGTCYILLKECNFSPSGDQEVIELVPNIILNPVFYSGVYQEERLYGFNENFSNETSFRINNNSVSSPVCL